MTEERIRERGLIRRLRDWLSRDTTREMLVIGAMLVTFPLFKVGVVRVAQLLFRLCGADLPEE